jgi:hypothetical protein
MRGESYNQWMNRVRAKALADMQPKAVSTDGSPVEVPSHFSLDGHELNEATRKHFNDIFKNL